MPANAVILDSNLLVLLVVGTTSRSYIGKHKRLRAYTDRDFVLLLEVLSAAQRIIVTPNTVTETSNLAGQIAEPARSRISRFCADSSDPWTKSMSKAQLLPITSRSLV